MQITSLTVVNFRAITRIELRNLPPSVVIAGPNGCGKSCVFDAIRLLKSVYGGYQPNEWQSWWKLATLRCGRSGRSIGVETTMMLGGRSTGFIFPGLRIHFHRRQAEQARVLREKVTADALLAEAIVRRERAREQAEVLKIRRRAAPDAWRGGVAPKRRRQRQRV